MITSIVLENFKCFRKVEVKPHLITAFVGPNGSGKSSVLQALVLLKQSLENRGLQMQGHLLNLGDYEHIQSRFQSPASLLQLGFEGTYPLLPPPSIMGFEEVIRFAYRSVFDAGSLVSSWGFVSFTKDAQAYTLHVGSDNKDYTDRLVMDGMSVDLKPGDLT
jgi:ABC-type branched-subunit amino acid transport system ATPase component